MPAGARGSVKCYGVVVDALFDALDYRMSISTATRHDLRLAILESPAWPVLETAIRPRFEASDAKTPPSDPADAVALRYLQHARYHRRLMCEGSGRGASWSLSHSGA